jgi:ATP-dependent helicase/nuclease subunit A
LLAPPTRKDGELSERKNFLRYFIDAGFLDEQLNVRDVRSVRVEKIAVDDLPIALAPRWDLPRMVQTAPSERALEKTVDETLRERERLRAMSDRSDLEPALVFASPSQHDAPLIAAESRPEGRKLGSAFHALVEHIDLADPTAWNEAAAQIARQFELGDEHAALVRRWLDNFARLASFAQVRGRPHWREVPLTWTDPHGVAYSGKLDLLADTPDGLLILDYKTDPATRANLARYVERYRRQGEIYRDAVRALRPDAKAVRMVFCFVDEGIERII